MGTAMGVCFGYWFMASGLFYGVAFVCNTHITFLQVLSMTVSQSDGSLQESLAVPNIGATSKIQLRVKLKE